MQPIPEEKPEARLRAHWVKNQNNLQKLQKNCHLEICTLSKNSSHFPWTWYFWHIYLMLNFYRFRNCKNKLKKKEHAKRGPAFPFVVLQFWWLRSSGAGPLWAGQETHQLVPRPLPAESRWRGWAGQSSPALRDLCVCIMAVIARMAACRLGAVHA